MTLRSCQFSSLADTFNFGKYCGITLADVLDINPSYIVWCVKHCDGIHFLLDDKALSQIKIVFPDFPINSHFEELCKNRFSLYDYDTDEYINSRNSNNDIDSYGQYSGSYAQDEMGYSDDDIDIIFDGDPDAYWNID